MGWNEVWRFINPSHSARPQGVWMVSGQGAHRSIAKVGGAINSSKYITYYVRIFFHRKAALQVILPFSYKKNPPVAGFLWVKLLLIYLEKLN